MRLFKVAPEQLDQAAFALSFFEEVENDRPSMEEWGILNQMRHDGLDPELVEAVRRDLTSERPTLHRFSGSTSMSALACRRLLPRLARGEVYSEACAAVYGDHRMQDFSFDNVTNPVVKAVVRESLKQVVNLIDETGKLPGRICVELARDLGKSIPERNQIDRGIRDRTKDKNAHRSNLEKEIGREPDPDELLRYELWLEQDNTCPYCGSPLCGDMREVASGHSLQIDHVLPRSRSHDNSYDNKVLVHVGCNQNKQNYTPFEYPRIGNRDKDGAGWRQYAARIQTMKRLRPLKRRHLLNTTFSEDENAFAARHLNDTRYISRMVAHHLQELYVAAGERNQQEKGARRRVFVQAGQLTAIVRKAWKLENLKKDIRGNRLGDKHHAVDALVCALLSERQRQFVVRWAQKDRQAAAAAFGDFAASYRAMEAQNDHHAVPRHVAPPWPTFRHDVAAAVDLFTVSRREDRKGRGSFHDDTCYSVREEDGGIVAYARKPLTKLVNGARKANLSADQIRDVKGIEDPRNARLKAALEAWAAAGCPPEDERLPRDGRGAPVRHVHVAMGRKSGRQYPHGFVTGGKLVRLDVFATAAKNGSLAYHLVPVYAHQIANLEAPAKAIVAGKEESKWTDLTESHRFVFSLWRNSRVEIHKQPSAKKPEGERMTGLYSGIDRNTGALMLTDPDDSTIQVRVSVKIGTPLFRKFETDRLGRTYAVKSEKRTWRGKTVD